MNKRIAVLVEQISEDEFLIWTNADEPTKSVNDHCALAERKVVPGWRLGIEKWLDQNGFSVHRDSDYSGAPFIDAEDYLYSTADM